MDTPDGPEERAEFLDTALAHDFDAYEAQCDWADTENSSGARFKGYDEEGLAIYEGVSL